MEGLQRGRMVHYVDELHQHYAAVVVNADTGIDGDVHLTVYYDDFDQSVPPFSGNGQPAKVLRFTYVPYSETPRANTWHWIERA